jgi:hypothetical protein
MERMSMHKGVIAEVLKQEAFWQERLDQIRLRRAMRPEATDDIAQGLAAMEASVSELLDDWKRLAEYVQGEGEWT